MQSLRSLRLSRGLRLVDLELSLGISNGHLSEMERGFYSPNTLTRRRIESFFGEPINWMDVSNLKTVPKFPSRWVDAETSFRSMIRMVAGLPEEEKREFTITAVKQLRKLLR